MLMRGTQRLDYESLRNEIDRLESRISVGGGGRGHGPSLSGDPGKVSASIQSDREHFADAIKLLGEIMKEPAFNQDEFDIVKKKIQASIEQGISDPQTLGMLELSRALRPWPKDSIHYVQTLEEQLEALEATKLDDLKEIYKNFFGANQCEIAIVGDFDPQEITPILKEIFAEWKAPESYERVIRPYRKATAADLVVDTPDKEMALVAMATALPMRDNDDDSPAMVMSSYVLGRSAKSRLMNKLRHEGGLSYGAGGGVTASSHDERASLMGYAICAPQNAAEAQAVLKGEIEKWLAEGITETELEEAKNSYELKFKSTLASESFLLSQLTSGLELDRTLEFRGELMKKIKALTVDDIKAALQRVFSDKEMVLVLAGDPNPKAASETADDATGKEKAMEGEGEKTDGKAGENDDPNDPWAKLVTLDENKNGTLEPSEVPPQIKAAFGQIDANKDGALDRDEIRAVIKAPPQQ